MKLRTDKILSPQKFAKNTYNRNSVHKSKVTISPSKMYVRAPVKLDTNSNRIMDTYEDDELNQSSLYISSDFKNDNDNSSYNKIKMHSHDLQNNNNLAELDYTSAGLKIKVKLSPSKYQRYN